MKTGAGASSRGFDSWIFLSPFEEVNTLNNTLFAPAIHVRFDGRSQRLNASQLGLPANASDQNIKIAVARALEVGERDLRAHVVERHDNGNITVRPQAVFG